MSSVTGLPWFRLYTEFMGDPVIQSMAFEDQRHYVVLLCMKCSGVIDRPVEKRMRDRIIARGLGLDSTTADEVKRRLMECGLCDSEWQPSGWDARQYKSDNSTSRVRKYRKTKETGNVSETLRNRFGNGPDTDTDTDQKTPLEPPPKKPPTRSPSGSRLPPDWTLPDEWLSWSVDEQMTIDEVRREADKFSDYWKATPGAKGRKADWFATWRNWCRRRRDDATARRSGDDGPKPSARDRAWKAAGFN